MIETILLGSVLSLTPLQEKPNKFVSELLYTQEKGHVNYERLDALIYENYFSSANLEKPNFEKRIPREVGKCCKGYFSVPAVQKYSKGKEHKKYHSVSKKESFQEKEKKKETKNLGLSGNKEIKSNRWAKSQKSFVYTLKRNCYAANFFKQ